jgi:hypothetical protein
MDVLRALPPAQPVVEDQTLLPLAFRVGYPVLQEDTQMFEKDIELAPPGSDRKTSFIIAQGIVEVLCGIEASLDEMVTILHNDTFEDAPDEVDEEPFPHFSSSTDEGPEPNSQEVFEAPEMHERVVTEKVDLDFTVVEEEVLPTELQGDEHPDLTAAVDATLRQEERELDPIAESFTRNTADES